MPENGYLRQKVDNYIATIEFHHPKGNSLTALLLKELKQAILQSGRNSDVRLIIIKSSGYGAFCAGASLDELHSLSDVRQGKKFFKGFANVLNAMRTCPKLIIARIHGKTVGGGVGLAAAADYTFAHSSSSIRLSELSLGIGPFVISPAIIRKIGTAAFSSLAIDPRTWYSAEWAESKGLYNNIQHSVEELDTAISELTGELASANPDALRELKKILWQNTGHWAYVLDEMSEISGRLALSDYTRTYLENFKKKKN